MIFQPYYLTCLSHASYLIGDEETGQAAVVDPQRDVEGYLRDAAERGLTIRHVFLTHFHADFVAGHLELRRRAGAVIHLGARARAEYPFEPAADGDTLDLGRVRLEILETPGHTPEGISILVHDRARDEARPWAVLTGDTLFLGDVGRPDLMASVGVAAEDLAGQLYDSLHEKLLPLPDETLVWPAHGAGSMCGKSLSDERSSPLGIQRATNPALQPMTREAFVRLVTRGQPEPPRYFGHDARVNREERETLDEVLAASLRPLALEEVLRRQNEGSLVLDTRSPQAFAAGHLRDSRNIPLEGRFATWCGTILDREKPILLVADAGREKEAATRLGRIGFDAVQGFLEGGAGAFAGRPDLRRRLERIDAAELRRRLATDDPPLVLDVRRTVEWTAGHLEESRNLPVHELESRLGEVPRDRPIAVHCQTGYRSSIAASILACGGIEAADLAGGFAAWKEAGGDVVEEDAGAESPSR